MKNRHMRSSCHAPSSRCDRAGPLALGRDLLSEGRGDVTSKSSRKAARAEQLGPVAVPPGRTTLEALRIAAARCKACDLWRDATQTVFGLGPAGAQLMLVGEQPGDKEDRSGEPFVGPAGHLLDRALADAGIDRLDVYLTNAVKHFRWRPSAGGKKRLHDKPSWTQVGACLGWLDAEIAAVEPEVVVCLGAVATQALLGRDARVGRDRGHVIEREDGLRILVTIHPAAVLRAPSEKRAGELASLVADLRSAADALDRGSNL
jgi:uracil-DNA glycosylase